jgi:hypothetical protein
MGMRMIHYDEGIRENGKDPVKKANERSRVLISDDSKKFW